MLVRQIRDPGGNNWDFFWEELKYRLEWGLEMNMEDDAGLELATLCVQQALISAYKGNCPLKPVMTGK